MSTRQIGCGLLSPKVIPDPHVSTIHCESSDEFAIVATRGLWKYVDYTEAIEEVVILYIQRNEASIYH